MSFHVLATLVLFAAHGMLGWGVGVRVGQLLWMKTWGPFSRTDNWTVISAIYIVIYSNWAASAT